MRSQFRKKTTNYKKNSDGTICCTGLLQDLHLSSYPETIGGISELVTVAEIAAMG